MWRLLDLYVLSFFVLLNSHFKETPKSEEDIAILKSHYAYVYSLLTQVIDEQIFLQEQGVSFSYTDTLSSFERTQLIQFYLDWREKKKNNNNS